MIERKAIVIPIIVLAMVLIPAAATLAMMEMTDQQSAPPVPTPTSINPQVEPQPTLSPAERQAYFDELERTGAGHRVPASGPSTRGSTIRVNGKEIKLPEDVYILQTGNIDCAANQLCAKAKSPIYVLANDTTTVTLDSNGYLWTKHGVMEPSSYPSEFTFLLAVRD